MVDFWLNSIRNSFNFWYIHNGALVERHHPFLLSWALCLCDEVYSCSEHIPHSQCARWMISANSIACFTRILVRRHCRFPFSIRSLILLALVIRIVFLSFISFIMRLYAIIITLIQIIFSVRLRLYHAIIIRLCELRCAWAQVSRFARASTKKERLNYCTLHNSFIAIIMRTIKLFSFDLKYHSETSDSDTYNIVKRDEILSCCLAEILTALTQRFFYSVFVFFTLFRFLLFSANETKYWRRNFWNAVNSRRRKLAKCIFRSFSFFFIFLQ